MASPRAVVAGERSESAPRIPISADTFTAIASENEQLARENVTLKQAVLSLAGEKQVLQYALLRLHERYDAMLAGMQSQLNDVALAASLVPSLQQKIEEIGALADRLAQQQTARNLRDAVDEESLNDALEAARAQE